MNDNQANVLLQRLLESTLSGSLTWNLLEGQPDPTVTTTIAGNEILLNLHIPSVSIRIFNSTHELVAESTPTRELQRIAQELYEAAWQTASGTNRVINDILRELSPPVAAQQARSFSAS